VPKTSKVDSDLKRPALTTLSGQKKAGDRCSKKGGKNHYGEQRVQDLKGVKLGSDSHLLRNAKRERNKKHDGEKKFRKRRREGESRITRKTSRTSGRPKSLSMVIKKGKGGKKTLGKLISAGKENAEREKL